MYIYIYIYIYTYIYIHIYICIYTITIYKVAVEQFGIPKLVEMTSITVGAMVVGSGYIPAYNWEAPTGIKHCHCCCLTVAIGYPPCSQIPMRQCWLGDIGYRDLLKIVVDVCLS